MIMLSQNNLYILMPETQMQFIVIKTRLIRQGFRCPKTEFGYIWGDLKKAICVAGSIVFTGRFYGKNDVDFECDNRDK